MSKRKINFYKVSKNVKIAAAICLILAVLIFIFVKDGVNRFTLIMPIFAAFILYMIFSEFEDDNINRKN